LTLRITPRGLRPGDLVAVCAPSGPPDPDRLRAGVAELERLGFRVRVAPHVLQRDLFTAGAAASRADELRARFEDDEVAAVWCARGGAGALQLMPLLDFARLAARAKVFVGYSDATPLHAALNREGLVTFHGPMVARDLGGGPVHEASLRAALVAGGVPYASPPGQLEPLRPGECEGVLLGGCLSLLAATEGTPWAFRPDGGTLLFLEDVDEPPYKLDRLLWQLREAGLFERVRGVVFGEMQGCHTGADVDYRLADVLLRALDGLDLPIAMGLPSGHTTRPNVTLPFGVRARLACRDGEARFEVLEPSIR
jgi:muramoyltetrapeptide carboxypeptidase